MEAEILERFPAFLATPLALIWRN